MNRLHRALLLAGFVASLAAASLTGWLVTSPEQKHERLMGWNPAALPVTATWTASLPPFELRHPVTGERVWQDNSTLRVCLYDDVAQANGGVYPENIRQLIGDCTSHGAAHAIEGTLGRQCIRGPPQQFRRISTKWLYGASRVWILKGQIRGDGSTGGANAKAAQLFGALPRDDEGPYTAEETRRWGEIGPPEQLKPLAAAHKVKSVALLRTAADVRDAVCNGFGVTIASSWGNPKESYQTLDGRLVARRTGSWMHQMCVDAYDGSSPSGARYFHVQNSWGPNAHPKPIDGSPPGGFWVTEAEIEYITAQGDSWAFSDFEGFPAALDLAPLRPRHR